MSIKKHIEVLEGLHMSDEFCELPHMYHNSLQFAISTLTALQECEDKLITEYHLPIFNADNEMFVKLKDVTPEFMKLKEENTRLKGLLDRERVRDRIRTVLTDERIKKLVKEKEYTPEKSIEQYCLWTDIAKAICEGVENEPRSRD